MESPVNTTAAPHPEEMRADLELRAGATVLRATVRATPAGFVAMGILVSAVLLSTATLARAVRHTRRSVLEG